MKCNDFSLKVFVEDTDFQGFVYHANYLKYFERARTQFLIDNQISQLNADGFFVLILPILFLLGWRKICQLKLMYSLRPRQG